MEQKIITVSNNNKNLFARNVVETLDPKLAILVPETHNAILVKDGQMLQTLSSGKYLLSKFVDPKTDLDSSIEVLFMSKTAKLKLLWGTPTNFLVYDEKLDENYHIGMGGSYEIQIGDPRKCYLYLVGVAENLMVDELQDRFLLNVVAVVEEVANSYLHENKVPFNQVSLHKKQISQKILSLLSQKLMNDYGIAVFSFDIANIIVNEDDLKRLGRILKGLPEQVTEENTESDVCMGCGAQLLPNAKFCYNCGKKVEREKVCQSCNTKNLPNAKFCASCGASLEGEE